MPWSAPGARVAGAGREGGAQRRHSHGAAVWRRGAARAVNHGRDDTCGARPVSDARDGAGHRARTPRRRCSEQTPRAGARGSSSAPVVRTPTLLRTSGAGDDPRAPARDRSFPERRRRRVSSMADASGDRAELLRGLERRRTVVAAAVAAPAVPAGGGSEEEKKERSSRRGGRSDHHRSRLVRNRRHGFGRGPLAWLRRWAVVQPPCPHRPRCSARVFDGFAAPWRTALVDLTRAGYAAVPAIRRGPFETSGGEAEKSARLRGPAAALTYARSLAWGSLATMRASRGATQPKLHGRVQ